jgi:hypothetical protein
VRCTDARKAIVERHLGALSRDAEVELRSHLDGCADCFAEARFEDVLARELPMLRGAEPFRVDVTGRVLREVAALGPVRTGLLPFRYLGWAAAAMVAFWLVWMAGGFFLGPRVVESAGEIGGVADRVAAIATSLYEPFLAILGALSALIHAFFTIIEPGLTLLQEAEPVVRVATIISVLAMIAISTYVLGKDLGLQPRYVRKESR